MVVIRAEWFQKVPDLSWEAGDRRAYLRVGGEVGVGLTPPSPVRGS